MKGTVNQAAMTNNSNEANCQGTEAIFNKSRTQDFEITWFQQQSSTSLTQQQAPHPYSNPSIK
jgi:hypothetical protein